MSMKLKTDLENTFKSAESTEADSSISYQAKSTNILHVLVEKCPRVLKKKQLLLVIFLHYCTTVCLDRNATFYNIDTCLYVYNIDTCLYVYNVDIVVAISPDRVQFEV